MRDSKMKQFIALFFGILANAIPALWSALAMRDIALLVVFMVVSLFLGLIGLGSAFLAIRQANENYERKTMAVTGLFFCINGLIGSLIMLLLFGLIFSVAGGMDVFY